MHNFPYPQTFNFAGTTKRIDLLSNCLFVQNEKSEGFPKITLSHRNSFHEFVLKFQRVPKGLPAFALSSTSAFKQSEGVRTTFCSRSFPSNLQVPVVKYVSDVCIIFI